VIRIITASRRYRRFVINKLFTFGILLAVGISSNCLCK
jgi:hypothetical protein